MEKNLKDHPDNPTHCQLTGLGLSQLATEYIKNFDNPYCCVFDIDGTIWLNEVFGLDITDQVIIRVAKEINESASERSALAFHIDGDEFMVVLPHSSHSDVVEYAQGTIQRISDLNIEYKMVDSCYPEQCKQRKNVQVNAVVCRICPDFSRDITSFIEWTSLARWEAKKEDRFKVGVIADMTHKDKSWTNKTENVR